MQHKWVTNSRVFFRSAETDHNYQSVHTYEELPPVERLDQFGDIRGMVHGIVDCAAINQLLADPDNYNTNVAHLAKDTDYLFKIDRDFTHYSEYENYGTMRDDEFPIVNEWFIQQDGKIKVKMDARIEYIVAEDIFEFLSRLEIETSIDKIKLTHKEAEQSRLHDEDEYDGYLFPVIEDPHGLWKELSEKLESRQIKYIQPYYDRCIANGYKQYWHKDSHSAIPTIIGYYCGGGGCTFSDNYICHQPEHPRPIHMCIAPDNNGCWSDIEENDGW